MLNTSAAPRGAYRMKADPKRAMEAYDRLPRVVRKALREARFCFSPLSAEDLIIRYRVSPEDVAHQIREDDAAMMVKWRRKLEGKE